MNNFNKISIYYRQCATNKANNLRPHWFDYEKVFYNLLSTINWKLCDLTVCFDGNEAELHNHFTKKYKERFPFRIILIDTKSYNGHSYEKDGSSKSSCLVAKIVKDDNLPESNLIYLLENDYIHRPFWSEITLDLFNTYIDDNYYISLYDHLDKYLFILNNEEIKKFNIENHWGMYKDLKSKIILSTYTHWREVPLICSSWIMSKRLFDRDYDLLSIGISDNTACGTISQRHSTRFLTPIPSLNTHCQNPFIAPYIDWEKIIKSNTIINE